MDKLKMQTTGKIDSNIEYIAAKFPNCITETLDENGKLTKVVDFDLLRQELSDIVVEGSDERYQFSWADKKKSILLANSPINKTLRPYREESVNFDTTQNLYLEGDNLDVLKLLQETYMGKVKMIYIDPPYNTGNDFVYEDDFAISAEEYLERSGASDEDGNRLFQNNDSNGRFHTDWLNMIYPRLKLAKDLLTDDGVIFISIDDNEQANLKKICDEIFGVGNFVAQITNVTGASQNGEDVIFQKNTEYVFCYAKIYQNANIIAIDKADENLRNLNDSPSPLHTRPDMGYTIYWNEKTANIIIEKDYNKDLIHTDDEKQIYTDNVDLLNQGYITIRPGRRNGFLNRWRWGFDTAIERKNDIIIQNGKAYFKQSGYLPPKNIQNFTVGTNEIKSLFNDKKIFDYPKSVKMLQYFTAIASNKDDIILDFFSGSATTAHAVMQLNAQDGGNRKFIMVQLPEATDEKSEAYKAGYKNICEIGKERIRRAGVKILQDNKNSKEPKDLANLDTGFRVLKADSSNMKPVFYNPAAISQDLFSKLEDNIKSDRMAEDLLFQVMLDMGIQLSSDIKVETIGGKTVYTVGGDNLVCCFDEGVTKKTVTEIAKRKPLYAIFRDSGFERDDTLVSFDQIFATYSPTTERRVI